MFIARLLVNRFSVIETCKINISYLLIIMIIAITCPNSKKQFIKLYFSKSLMLFEG